MDTQGTLGLPMPTTTLNNNAPTNASMMAPTLTSENRNIKETTFSRLLKIRSNIAVMASLLSPDYSKSELRLVNECLNIDYILRAQFKKHTRQPYIQNFIQNKIQEINQSEGVYSIVVECRFKFIASVKIKAELHTSITAGCLKSKMIGLIKQNCLNIPAMAIVDLYTDGILKVGNTILKDNQILDYNYKDQLLVYHYK